MFSVSCYHFPLCLLLLTATGCLLFFIGSSCCSLGCLTSTTFPLFSVASLSCYSLVSVSYLALVFLSTPVFSALFPHSIGFLCPLARFPPVASISLFPRIVSRASPDMDSYQIAHPYISIKKREFLQFQHKQLRHTLLCSMLLSLASLIVDCPLLSPPFVFVTSYCC